MKLYELTKNYQELQTLADSDDLPADVLRDTLEALSGDIEEKATNVAAFVRNLEADADAIEAAAKAMQARAARVRNRADGVRAYLQFCMEATGIRKIACPHFVIALRENHEAVQIAEGVDVPAEFMTQPEPPAPAPDKKKLLKALKAGRQIDGVYLTRGERLEIKT